MSEVVGVIGGGTWGRALAAAAQRAGKRALICTRREHQPLGATDSEQTADLRELGDRASLIIMAVPSTVLATIARALGDVIDGRHFVVHAIRGLSADGLTPLSDVIRRETPARRVGALAGPVLASDLMAGQPSVIAVGSRYPEVVSAVQEGLGSPTLRVAETHDLAGVEWASALVGVLLVGMGFAQSIGLGAGVVAGFMTGAMREATALGVAGGAEAATFYGLAGFGDLLGAMGQTDRPELRLGRALATGGGTARAVAAAGARVEAVELLPHVVEYALQRRIEIPIIRALDDVLAGRTDPATVMPSLMRPAGR